MPRVVLRSLIAALCIALIAPSAIAREDYCVRPGSSGDIDRAATQQFRQLDNNVNARLMQQLRGTWYSRLVAGPQVSEVWETYGRNRIYSYLNSVCDLSTGFCAVYGQNSTGLYAVRADPDNRNRFIGMKIVNDIHRDHECRGLIGRFTSNNRWVGSGGFVARRVSRPGARP